MDFERLQLSHLGATADDGMNLLDEIEQKLDELSQLICSELYEERAKITVTIDLSRDGDRGVRIGALVKAQEPAKLRRSVHAYMSKDGLVTESFEQICLPGMQRNKGERGIKDAVEKFAAELKRQNATVTMSESKDKAASLTSRSHRVERSDVTDGGRLAGEGRIKPQDRTVDLDREEEEQT